MFFLKVPAMDLLARPWQAMAGHLRRKSGVVATKMSDEKNEQRRQKQKQKQKQKLKQKQKQKQKQQQKQNQKQKRKKQQDGGANVPCK